MQPAPSPEDYENDPSVGTALTNATEQAQRKLDDLEARATTDSLTGFLNREAFFEQFEQMLARLDGQRQSDESFKTLAVLMIDIDRFKSVNDTFGRQAGDRVIQEVANVIRDTIIRGSDIVGRIGGEEFVVVLENPGDIAYKKAEEIRTAIADNVARPDGDPVTVSIGLVQTTGSRGSERLSLRADQLLYQAKKAGRNRVELEPGHDRQ